ncbi:phosphatidylinositol N-acetylglucosaminyltransferase subunit P [Leptopilina heterotoma]|uniref:phosphatidylinositol N-acetylglucosaminyltransferase subunit P n=1 Tax=Leptopilina heterotoma TaxID=63436 RepID=UPI001CA9DC52|nr:phosphatidylinositol N-acetylglucosaminyltransferase subunit P [Leptopilina heterotoma]
MAEHTPAPYAPRSVYGYALYISSNLLILLYLIWAFVPEEFLNDYLGLTYWPSKYWAVAIPVWAIFAILLFGFVIYPAINMLLTPDIDDIRTITDKYSVLECKTTTGGIPPISDIPITQVCRTLYFPDDNENDQI